MVLKSTSFKLTPPQVTNSSLNCPLPVMWNSPAHNSCASWRSSALDKSAQFFSPTNCVNCFHNLKGICENAGFVATFLRAFSFHSLLRVKISSVLSKEKSSSQFTVNFARYFFSAKILAPQAEHFSTAGPLMPQCVTSNAPRVVTVSIFKVTFSTDKPAKPSMRLSLTLNVNSEGTGSTMVCPND